MVEGDEDAAVLSVEGAEDAAVLSVEGAEDVTVLSVEEGEKVEETMAGEEESGGLDEGESGTLAVPVVKGNVFKGDGSVSSGGAEELLSLSLAVLDTERSDGLPSPNIFLIIDHIENPERDILPY